MKKIAYFIVALAGIFTSCSREAVEIGKAAPDIIASLEEGIGESTKTSLFYDGATNSGVVYWTPGDEINVFYHGVSTRYITHCSAPDRSVEFASSDIISVETDLGYGLYPYSSSANSDGDRIYTELPCLQDGVPGTFDEGLAIAAGIYRGERNLEFKNVLSGIQFSLDRDDITAVSFKGNNDEYLAGPITIEFADGIPVSSVSSGMKRIILTPKTGETFVRGTRYMIMAVPANLSNGFTMTFYTSELKGVLTRDEQIILSRNNIAYKENIDSYAVFGYKVPVTGVELNKTSTVIYYGGTETLSASFIPANSTHKVITWSSSNPSVASVDADGKVTAHALGTATITVESEDGAKTATCEVTVTLAPGQSEMTYDEDWN